MEQDEDEEDEEEDEEEEDDHDLSEGDMDDLGDDGESESEESDFEQEQVDEEDVDEDKMVAPQQAVDGSSRGAETMAVAPEPAAPAKYIPPSLRAAQLAEKSKGDAGKVAEKLKLERKAQGLLNKLVLSPRYGPTC